MKTELIEKVKEDLVRHEGYVTEIYLDTEHLPTFGIGHLVTEQDIEYGWPVGTPVTDERILQVFHDDVEVSYTDACTLFLNFSSLPENVQRVCINMAFNLGLPRLRGFKKFLKAMEEGDFQTASVEMMDSRWATQVGDRAKRLRDRVAS